VAPSQQDRLGDGLNGELSANRVHSVKIAYLVTRADPIGGAQIHVRDLTIAARDLGHEPSVITGGSGPFTDTLRAQGIATYSLRHLVAPIRPVADFRALGEIRDVLGQIRPDLLSTHSSKAGILGRLVGRSLEIPVIFTAHGWAFTPGVPKLRAALYQRIERMAGGLASRIITVSEFDRRLALMHGVASESQIITVHNGMPDIPAERRADPARSPVRLVMVARFELQKDHRTLLHTLGGLRQYSWELDLIGDGPLKGEIARLGESLGIANRIRFLGQVLDVEARLADAQAFLLISNWEGFPRSILEAMRAGLPVVASAVGGIEESVHDGESGFVVRRGDTEGLRSRIEQLLLDPGLRQRLGANGRNRYERDFTLARTVEETLAVYRGVLEDWKHPEAKRITTGGTLYGK
jgi:glycosyltransferase involved in cell wall biosynthesis